MTKAAVKERTATLLDEVESPAKPKAEVVVAAPKAKKKTGTEISVHQPSSPAAPKTMLQVIAEAAANPLVDVQKMQALLTMRREEERAAQEIVFNDALRAAKLDMPTVGANSINSHTKSNWAKYEKVSKVCDPIIHRHGFVLSFGMSDSPLPEHYRIICDVSHEGGYTKRYFLDGPADAVGAKGGGTKTPIQGVGSTITYLRRVLKGLIFDIIVDKEDDDGIGAVTNLIDAEQTKDLRTKMTAANITDAQFCSVYGLAKVEELPAAKLVNALDRIAQKQRVA